MRRGIWSWRNIKITLALAVVATTLTTAMQHALRTSPAPRVATAACASEGVAARVTKVTDGDTIHTQLLCGPEAGATTTDRIIGINTPETKKPRSPVQCYGPQASAYAAGQLAGHDVVLVADAKAGHVDKYGRRLFFVEVGGRDYGADAIRAGYAEHNDYGHRESRSTTYKIAQAEAQLERAGAWGACPSPFKK